MRRVSSWDKSLKWGLGGLILGLTLSLAVAIVVLLSTNGEGGEGEQAVLESSTPVPTEVSSSATRPEPTATPIEASATATAPTPTVVPTEEPTADNPSSDSDDEHAVLDDVASTESWEQYQNDQLGFSLRHPADWIVYQGSSSVVAFASDEMLSASGLTPTEGTMFISLELRATPLEFDGAIPVSVGSIESAGEMRASTTNGRSTVEVSYSVDGNHWLITGGFGHQVDNDGPWTLLFWDIVNTLNHREIVAADETSGSEELIPLTPEYVEPVAAINRAMHEIFDQPNRRYLTRLLEGSRPIEIRNAYHLDNAEVGEFNADTREFYPWLLDHLRVRFAEEPTNGLVTDSDASGEHARLQVRTALTQPDSGIGIRLRDIQYGTDPIFDSPGPDAYWWYLIAPSTQMISISDQARDNMEKAFFRHAWDYHNPILSSNSAEADPDFGLFLEQTNFLDVWFPS